MEFTNIKMHIWMQMSGRIVWLLGSEDVCNFSVIYAVQESKVQ